MKWFDGIKTVAELRKRYKELLKQYHPDNENGSVEITQEINSQYDSLFDVLSQETQSDTQSYNKENDEQFKTILNAIISYNMTIEIIGSWVWCFDCYPFKDKLKTLGFTWCSKKRAWVWHSQPYRRYHKKEIPLNHIRAKYGSEIIKKQSYQYSLD